MFEKIVTILPIPAAPLEAVPPTVFSEVVFAGEGVAIVFSDLEGDQMMGWLSAMTTTGTPQESMFFHNALFNHMNGHGDKVKTMKQEMGL